MADLTTSYMGLGLKNPIIVGSSGLTNSVEDIIALEKNGAAAVILKSIFEEDISAGLKQVSGVTGETTDTLAFDYQFYKMKDKKLEAYLNLIKQAKQQAGIPIIASINCVSEFEWPHFAQLIEQAGADALELNVFPSPMNFNHTCVENEQTYFDIAEKVKSNIEIPAAMKINPYSANLGPFIKRISQTGLDGIAMFNRFRNLDFDIENLKIINSNVLSKTEEYSLALRWIATMSGGVDCDISASTGVHSGETLIKFLLAGASSVQIVSAVYRQGPKVIAHFLQELKFWMERHGHESIIDFQGKMSLSPSVDNPSNDQMQYIPSFLGTDF